MLKDTKVPMLKVGDAASAASYLGDVGTLTTALHEEEMLLLDFCIT